LNTSYSKEWKMKKLTIIFLTMIFSVFLISAETIANVTSHKNLILTVDRGTMDGVESGMKGIVKAVYKDPSGEYPMNIGTFTVRKVSERSAEVAIEIGKGLNPADARYVVFEQNLTPMASKTEPAGPAAAVETVDEHLDQGDKAAEAENFKAALEHYQKALALEPGNLVAQEKCSEMQKKIVAAEKKAKCKDYLKKADDNYGKNDIKFAFLYLIEALRIFPDGSGEVKKRLGLIAREYPQELAAILNEKSEELKDIRAQIDSLLGKKAETKPVVTEPVATTSEFNEPFLRKISGKAEKISRNAQGSWEAVFAKGITMVYIPEGEFTIGSPAQDGDADEHPAHKVFVAGFWIGKTEVTFEQYDRFCTETGRESASDEDWGRDNLPVIYVSWNDARDYCAWLAKKTGLNFRLPSEAEWEKAAHDRYPWGNASPTASLANFNKDIMKTISVGSYPQGASPYGVLDLAGNVWEWLADWYDPGFYANSPRDNPRGPESGSERVVRGGSWANGNELIRSANRSHEDPANKLNILGFRLALDGK
jgi:formylglycine-generating enzyme required for sulfatase activity